MPIQYKQRLQPCFDDMIFDHPDATVLLRADAACNWWWMIDARRSVMRGNEGYPSPYEAYKSAYVAGIMMGVKLTVLLHEFLTEARRIHSLQTRASTHLTWFLPECRPGHTAPDPETIRHHYRQILPHLVAVVRDHPGGLDQDRRSRSLRWQINLACHRADREHWPHYDHLLNNGPCLRHEPVILQMITAELSRRQPSMPFVGLPADEQTSLINTVLTG